jgi:hypothetical protein
MALIGRASSRPAGSSPYDCAVVLAVLFSVAFEHSPLNYRAQTLNIDYIVKPARSTRVSIVVSV